MTVWPNGSKAQPRVSSPFGPRKVTVPGASSFHQGVDLIGFSTICATDPGTVLGVGILPGWAGGGYQVYIMHADYTTRDLHMVAGSILVRQGQQVAEGQALGLMGKTGTAGGVHDHHEVAVRGYRVDPVPFYRDRIAAAAGGGGRPFPDDEEDDMFDDEAKATLDAIAARPTQIQPLHTRIIRNTGDGNIVMLHPAGWEFISAEAGAADGAALLAGQPLVNGHYWIDLPADRFAWELARHEELLALQDERIRGIITRMQLTEPAG